MKSTRFLNFWKWIFVFIVGITPTMLRAQDAGTLDELSLEDLLNVQVVTASKNAESISDAPGVISTITAKEIEQFGASNLLEVFERIPGAYIMGSSLFPQGNISLRGDAATSVNNHVLILLDGRPMRESLNGGLNTGLYTTFPVETIDRVEVVRGPGSVLYGSNAYAGVINIITKQEPDGAGLRTNATYGSYDTRSIAVQGGYKGNDLSVSGAFHLEKENAQGEYFKNVAGTNGQPATREVVNPGEAFNLSQDVISGTLSARYKRLSLRSFAGFNTESTYSGISTMAQSIDFSHVTADLGYEQPVTSWWNATLNSTFTYDRTAYTTNKINSHDIIVEATNYIQPFANANLVIGGLAYTLSGEYGGLSVNRTTGVSTPIDYIKPYDEFRWSAYTQLDFRPMERLKLIGGGQFNKVKDMDLDFVPRLGAIVNVTDELGAKLLYGQAFRSPYARELAINIPNVKIGNPDLMPEKVTSFDAQVFYNASHMQLGATYFHANQDNIISMSQVLLPGATRAIQSYINKGNMTIQGVELESKLAPNDRVYVTGSFVYQRSKDADGEWGTTLVPEVTGKLGVSYALPAGVTLGLFDSYYSAPRPANEVMKTRAFTNGMKAPEAFQYVTAKLSVNVTKLMHLNGFPTVQFDLYGMNLLDKAIYISEIEMASLSVPFQSGRSVYTALRVKL